MDGDWEEGRWNVEPPPYLWAPVVLYGQAAFAHNHVLGGAFTDLMWADMTFSDDDRFIALSGSRGIVLVDAFTLREVR